MSVLLLALLLACSGSSTTDTKVPVPEGTFSAGELPRGPSSDALPLHLLLDDATFELADSNLPAGFGADATLEIPLAAHRRGKRAMIPLPFELDAESRTRFGQDLTVRVDGRLFRYAPLGGGSNTWRLLKNQLVLGVNKRDQTATLSYAGAQDLVNNRVLSASGKSPAGFVASSVTLGGRTVPGLMLTSPSTVSWKVKVPAKAPRFRATTSVMPAVSRADHSDGLSVQLEATVGETVTVIATQELDSVAFVDLEADLAAFAGQEVTLTLRSLVTGTPDHDYAFVGAPTVWGTPDQDVRRVLVIGLDTTRPASIGWYGYDKPTTPELDAIANQSAVAVNAWCPASRTRPSFRSATTGRYPLLAVGATNIGEVFQERGFATAGFVANIHLQPRFDFHEGFDTWLFDGRANADQQVDRALAWFGEHADRDSYMFLHFMDPHLLYDAPEPYREQFVADPDPGMPRSFSRWQVSRWAQDGTLTPQRQAHLTGLYDGEMRFTSHEIGRLIKALDELPGKTTIVIHSDHGEEFFEHGGFEHNHTLYEEVTRAVLMLRPPGGTVGGPVRMQQNATLADIAPTLYDMMGFDDLPPTDGISLRPNAEGAAAIPRDIGIGHLRYGLDRYAVIHDQHKYVIETGSGKEELYNLTADPGEQADLASKADLAPYRTALINAHPELRGGPGWRIHLEGKIPDFTLALPPGSTADVLSPDASSPNRPNLAWGEKPHRGPDSVGVVAVDGTTLSFESAGSNGQLWALFNGDAPLPSAVRVRETDIPLVAMDGGRVGYRFSTGGQLQVEPAMVLVPPPGEADRMRELGGATQDASKDETCRLCELGYIEGASCEDC